jgi:hypothetical protein
MFTTGTSPRFADDGSCQHHLEHALQVQYESAQSFVSFYHQKNGIKDRNSETKVGDHRNPLPLCQACIYPALGTGDLQCSPGFLPRAAIHRALPWCLSPGTHFDLLMTESVVTPRTHLTQAQKTKNNKKKKRKRTLQSRSCSTATIIP